MSSKMTYSRMPRGTFESRVYRVIRPEFKQFALSTSTAIASFTGTSSNFGVNNGIIQGDTQYTRTGNRILLKSLSVKCIVSANTASEDVYQTYRIVIFNDLSNHYATVPNPNAMFDVPVSGANELANITLSTAKWYQIIKDTGVQYVSEADGAIPSIKTYNWYFPLNLVIQYAAVNGTPSDMTNNAIYVMIWTSMASNPPNCNFNVRSRFVDC